MTEKKTSLRKRILYFLYLFVVVAIGLELIARFYLGVVLEKATEKKFRFNSYRIYEHVPGFTEGNHEGNWIVINQQGFRRSEEVVKEKPDGTYRIFLMGGSAAHGISSGAPYPIRHIYQNETIDAYLEEKLNSQSDSINFEVINAAVTGYQVFQHTTYLASELLDYDPDLIIFFDGVNDHYANNPDFNFYMGNRYQFWKNRLQDPSLAGLFDYTAYWLADYSALFRGYFAWKLQRDAILNGNKEDLKIQNKDEKERIKNHKIAASKTFLRSIRTNLDILKANDVDAILGLQPMLVLRDSSLLSDDETAFLHADNNAVQLYPLVTNEIDSIASLMEVDYVDFVPIFNRENSSKKQLFIDYCHLTPLGGEVTADTLASKILSKF